MHGSKAANAATASGDQQQAHEGKQLCRRSNCGNGLTSSFPWLSFFSAIRSLHHALHQQRLAMHCSLASTLAFLAKTYCLFPAFKLLLSDVAAKAALCTAVPAQDALGSNDARSAVGHPIDVLQALQAASGTTTFHITLAWVINYIWFLRWDFISLQSVYFRYMIVKTLHHDCAVVQKQKQCTAPQKCFLGCARITNMHAQGDDAGECCICLRDRGRVQRCCRSTLPLQLLPCACAAC